jgi:hypothetical protein
MSHGIQIHALSLITALSNDIAKTIAKYDEALPLMTVVGVLEMHKVVLITSHAKAPKPTR